MSFSELTSWIGETLAHFLWQGTALAVAVWLGLVAARRRPAELRYLVCCTGMLLMLAAPIVTASVLLGEESAALRVTPPFLESTQIPASWIEDGLPWLTGLWAAGVAFLSGRGLVQWLRAQHLRRRGISPLPREWQQTLEQLRCQLGVRRTVSLVESTLATVPMVIGWLRPVILVPATALTGLSSEQLRLVLAHELAHVRRGDYLVNLVQTVFEALLFYHPAVWWLSNRIRIEREYCCDDVAVGVNGDALTYARALSSLDLLRSGEWQPALASTGGSLMNRITRLLGVPKAPNSRTDGWMAPLAVATVVALSGTAVAFTHSTAQKQVPDPLSGPALDKINVVGIVEVLDPAQGKALAELQERGLDNAGLVLVLKDLGAGPEVFEILQKAVVHAEKYTREHDMVRRKIEQALQSGRLSREDAEKQLEKLAWGEREMSQKIIHHLTADREQQEWVEELKQQGLSDLQIKERMKRRKIEEHEHRQQEFIHELRSRGHTDQEIHELLEKKHRAREIEREHAHRVKKMAHELREKGLSDQEIHEILKDRHQEHSQARLDSAAREMRVRGLSDEEIHAALSQKREALEKTMRDHEAMEAHLLEMHRRGMSKEEIHRALQELREVHERSLSETKVRPSPSGER